MLSRLSIKDSIIFNNLELDFSKNFIIFSGASGSGKSVLMENILTLFGYKDSESKSIEAITNSKLDMDNFGIENEEENIFKFLKQKSSRYFINGSQISKKNLQSISKGFINYLNLREFDEFENKNLLNLLDHIALNHDKTYQKTLDKFKSAYDKYKLISNQLLKIQEDEKKIEDLKEFAKFEIDKIESINPKVDEYEELLLQKKELSKKEKLENAIEDASNIFEIEHKVTTALTLLENDSSFFSESINTLNIIFQEASERLQNLDELDIESLLNRIEELSSLKNKYGSIEEALKYLENKKKELLKYENISYEKKELQDTLDKLEKDIATLTKNISAKRVLSLKTLNQDIKNYSDLLFLENISFQLTKIPLHQDGVDKVSLTLGDTTLKKVSSGELNRIRLAYLASSSNYLQNSGVLILDEIDANLSGKESMSVAKVLKELSKNYQIFAISHQPQLSSFADEHFLVYKDQKSSSVKKLTFKQRVDELSRMISGEKLTQEAKDFALKMLEQNQS